ncbi:hypothetical protein NDU88_006950 [Pleurodeles waltl]|uniref:Uncharacterized protein n=1 Tax=Pleurodeles waltl TaxID=8319 RepID=A0AAV7SR52_PLEWA|nr:hypothetical protein NDU88_006950 [Pleurodeles waltl]
MIRNRTTKPHLSRGLGCSGSGSGHNKNNLILIPASFQLRDASQFVKARRLRRPRSRDHNKMCGSLPGASRTALAAPPGRRKNAKYSTHRSQKCALHNPRAGLGEGNNGGGMSDLTSRGGKKERFGEGEGGCFSTTGRGERA